MNESYFDKNSYLNFDALSLKSLIVDRLNKGKVFTDQNYQGSNLSALIDVISLVFGNLLFYLNKSSSESMFSEAQLYENMNRIVKLLSYKPVGKVTSTVPIRINVTSALAKNNYTIPRYSYINIAGSAFSFKEDVSFSKIKNFESENITPLNDRVLLYQGLYEEYPLYTAVGLDNEQIYLTLDEKIFVDHYSIDVYVRDVITKQWLKYQKVNELFLHSSNETVYEIRYNENKRYEIIFGDDVNGKKLNAGDEVLVYYLRTNPEDIVVGAGGINNQFVIRYNSLLFPLVLDDTNTMNANYLSIENLREVKINNAYPSTEFKNEETVEEIRKNAPQSFRSQYRLATKLDYESYIKNNFSNHIQDVKILNNNDYLSKYMKYLYNIGLKNPHTETNILYNQVKFANACNFNNLYICAVPKTANQSFLTPPQKEIIINGLEPWKILTTELVPMEPVYVIFDFLVPNAAGTAPTLNDLAANKLMLYKSQTSSMAEAAIVSKIKEIFEEQFLHSNAKLGQYIDINRITNQILAMDDIEDVKTYNSITNQYTDGVSLLAWNYYYPNNDKRVYTQNLLLEEFKFPVFNGLSNIQSQITFYRDPAETDATQF
jgi:hypothetical protein